jgi:hypothetical protein
MESICTERVGAEVEEEYTCRTIVQSRRKYMYVFDGIATEFVF